jgi:guanine deaminase
MEVATLFRGTVVHSASRTTLSVLKDAVLGVNAAGKVAFLEDKHAEPLAPADGLQLRDGTKVPLSNVRVVALPPRGFIIPGFVDTHTHAPQFAFAGTGYDLQLLDWLNTYTFPAEAKFADAAYAAKVCDNAVRRTLASGSTSCVYFGTIHTDAALLLGRTAAQRGQRSFVGKVNMDRNAPDFYCESTADSVAETERFVTSMLGAGADGAAGAPLGPPAVPVITPRFVPTCSSELMKAPPAEQRSVGQRRAA